MPQTVAGGEVTESGTDAERADAFRRLADGHLDDSYRLANAILGSPIEARDAVHDAFITGWRRWPSLRDIERFEPWFKSIVVNTCRDRLRRAARLRTTDVRADTGPSAPDAAAEVHDRMLIEQGFARLKPDDRIVLALRYYRDLKIEDIAAVLDIPPGTATSRLRSAHIRLRDVIDQIEPNEASR